MLKELVKLANNLDSKGLRKEADLIDNVILKLSQEDDDDNNTCHGVEWKEVGETGEAGFPKNHIIWEAKGHPQKRLRKGVGPCSIDYDDSPTVTKSPVAEKAEEAEEAEKVREHERDLAGNLEHYLGWVSEGLRGSDKD